MAKNISRRTLGTQKVNVRNLEHVRIFHDANTYAAHPNRGGIWNFSDGQLAVAHRVKTIDYSNPQWRTILHPHNFAQMPTVTKLKPPRPGRRNNLTLHR